MPGSTFYGYINLVWQMHPLTILQYAHFVNLVPLAEHFEHFGKAIARYIHDIKASIQVKSRVKTQQK